MNRQAKRKFQRDVEGKLGEIRGIQAELKKPTTVSNYARQMKRVAHLFRELETMGAIRKKSKIEKIKDKVTDFFRWPKVA